MHDMRSGEVVCAGSCMISMCAYLEVLVTGKEVWQVHRLVGTPLRDHYNATNLLDLRVIRWTHTIQVT